jgi:hypothetical protein
MEVVLGQAANDQVVLVIPREGDDELGLVRPDLRQDLGAGAAPADDLALDLLAELGDDFGGRGPGTSRPGRRPR